MKKILTLAFMAMLTFSVASCDRNNDNTEVVSPDTYSTAYDINGANFVKDQYGVYSIIRNFNSDLIESDVVLIYRQYVADDGQLKYQSIPRTLFVPQGELDIDFEFNKKGIRIMAGGNFDPALAPNFINNQFFRVVVVPAKTGKNADKEVDLTNYEQVIKFYNIKESNIRSL